MALSKSHRVMRPCNRDPANRMHPFDLVVGTRTYRLAAYTAEEAEAWCAVLCDPNPNPNPNPNPIPNPNPNPNPIPNPIPNPNQVRRAL